MSRRNGGGCGCGCLGFLGRLIGVVVLIAVLVGYPYLEAMNVVVVETTLTSDQLPAAFDGFRIVFLSDIHEGQWIPRAHVAKIIEKVNAQNADVVLLGGDYAEDPASAIAFFNTLPTPFQAATGVAGVVGNNDRPDDDATLSALKLAMRQAGVSPLVNDVVRITRGGDAIYLYGADDAYRGFPSFAGFTTGVRAEDYVIVLAHSPDTLPVAQAQRGADGRTDWFDLYLCGHTHGGQVVLFGKPLLQLLQGNTTYEAENLSGWKRAQNADILISNGVGVSGLPLRFGAQAQIHVITLRRDR